MTGFASSQGQSGELAWTWELKSVNGKGLDVRVRVPSAVDGLDIAARKLLQRRFSRGTLFANLTLGADSAATALRINRANLDAAVAAARAVEEETGFAPPSVDGILRLRGVLESDEPAAALGDEDRKAVLAGLEAAAEKLAGMRKEEGRRLAGQLLSLTGDLRGLTATAKGLDAAQPEAIRERFREKVGELLADSAPLQEDRVEQEVALLALKADIREELDRLDSHLAAVDALLAEGGAVGRRLDFLAQELNREANTLVSKASDMALSRAGLDMKAVIDQFREQVQNIE